MSYEEEFDRIIKQKAEQADFPFNNNDWEKAAAMLNAERGAAGLPLWKKVGIPAVIGLAAIVTTVVLWPSTNNSNTSLSDKTKNLNQPVITQQAEKNNTSTETTQPSQINTDVASVISPNAGSEKNKKVNTVAAPTQAEEFIASDAPVAGNAAVATPKSNRRVEEEKIKKSNSAVKVSINTTSVELPENAPSDDKVSEPAAMVETKQAANNHANATANPNAENSAGTVLPPAGNQKNEEVVLAQNNANAQASTPVVQTEAITNPAWLPSKTLLLENNFDSANVSTTLQMPVAAAPIDYVKKSPNYFVRINAGAHYAFGWETATGIDGKGLNYFGGVDFGKYINNDLTFSAGLQYFRFSNIVNPYYTSIGKGYSFGYTQKYAGVTVDQLNYLAVPLSIAYTSKDGILFGAGFTTNYLVGAHSRVDSYGISDGVKGQMTSVGSKKIYDGTNSFTFMANVRLGYALSRRFSIYGEMQYGLNDLLDSKTKKQNNERATGLRVGLNYYLISK